MVAAVAALVALAAVLAACGSSNTTASNAADKIAKAASASSASAGYKINLKLQVSSPGLPNPITGTGTGSFQTKEHAGSMSIDMNLGNSPQITAALGGSTLHMEEVINGLVIYLKFPAAIADKLSPGKPWFKIDLSKAAASAGIPGLSSLTNNPASTDPTQLLQYLRAVSSSVSTVGSETINGVQTTHYRATIDLDKVPNAVPAANRSAAQQSIKAIETATGVHTLPVDVWIDGQNLVRRMSMTIKVSQSGQTANTQTTIDIPEYGPQPAPTIPPASQVTDFSSLTSP